MTKINRKQALAAVLELDGEAGRQAKAAGKPLLHFDRVADARKLLAEGKHAVTIKFAQEHLAAIRAV